MASGNSMFFAAALANSPPTTSAATFNVRNNTPVYEFDNSNVQTALFQGLMPRNYTGGGITVLIEWAAKTDTSNTTTWAVAFERHQDGTDTIAADSFAAEQSTTSTAPGTSGVVKYTTISFTDGAQMDNVAAGEFFRLKVRRTGGSMAGLSQLIALEGKET